jgi:hypothetical protein
MTRPYDVAAEVRAGRPKRVRILRIKCDDPARLQEEINAGRKRILGLPVDAGELQFAFERDELWAKVYSAMYEPVPECTLIPQHWAYVVATKEAMAEMTSDELQKESLRLQQDSQRQAEIAASPESSVVNPVPPEFLADVPVSRLEALERRVDELERKVLAKAALGTIEVAP